MSGYMKAFLDSFHEDLGPKAEELISEKTTDIRQERQELKEEQQQLKETERAVANKQELEQKLQDLKNKKEQTDARRTAMEDEHGSFLENQNEIDRLKRLEKI